MMQELYNKMSKEYSNLSKELEMVKNTNLKDATEALSQNLHHALQENFNNLDNSTLKSPPLGDAFLDGKRNYYLDGPTNLSSYHPPESTAFNYSPRKPILPSEISTKGLGGLPSEDPQITYANELINKARKLREEPFKPVENSHYQKHSATTPYGIQSPISQTHQFDYGNTSAISPMGFGIDKRSYSPINNDSERRNLYSPPKTFDKRELSPIRENYTSYQPSSLLSGPQGYEYNPSQFTSTLTSYRSPPTIGGGAAGNTYDHGLNRANEILKNAREIRDGVGINSYVPPDSASSFHPQRNYSANNLLTTKETNLPFSMSRGDSPTR